MKLIKTSILFVIFLICSLPNLVIYADEVPMEPKNPVDDQIVSDPVLLMLEPGVFEIGGCTITKEHNRVEFPATINMNDGLLEYVIVNDTGKVHESFLRTQVEPYALQIALLLTGLEGGANTLLMQGTGKPEGDFVDIWISWLENGQEKKLRMEECILVNNEPVNGIPWVFTGSVVADGVFMAQIEKSIVAVYHDSTALIDHQLESGANDEIWITNSSVVPEVGTDVKVIIEKK